MHRTFCLVSVLALCAIWLPLDLHAQTDSADSDWQTTPLLSIDQLSVSLDVKAAASLADAQFIRVVFANRGKEPIRLANFQYVLKRQVHNGASGQLMVTGGLGQGSLRDLFPDAGNRSVELKPGTQYSAEYPSQYAAALLGRAPAEGGLVSVAAYASVTLEDGRQASIPLTDESLVKFRWEPLDVEGIDVVHTRLTQMLSHPVNSPPFGYLIDTFLSLAEVAERTTVPQVLTALTQRQDEAFSGRDAILRFLNEYHSQSKEVLDYVHDRLEAGDVQFVSSQLYRLPLVWSPAMREPLLKLYRQHGHLRDQILRHFDRHVFSEDANTQLARELSRQLGDVLLNEKIAEKLRKNTGRRPQAWIAQMGLTRDERFVAILIPLLDERAVSNQPIHVALGQPAVPDRVCDAAHNAILMIRGEPFPETEFAAERNEQLRNRDEAIDALQDRLAKIDKYRAILVPADAIELNEDMAAVARRWRSERRRNDLMALMEHVGRGVSAAAVRHLLGQPIHVVENKGRESWLYAKPQWRDSIGSTVWLDFDDQLRTTIWRESAWDARYHPEDAPPVVPRSVVATQISPDQPWDDVTKLEGDSRLLLRRGEKLYQLQPPENQLQRVGEFRALMGTRIVKTLAAGDATWLFCESPRSVPLAVELASGRVVSFDIPGLAIPGSHTPSIQSFVDTPAGYAILMIAGGDRPTWPRPGNRPIYFAIRYRDGNSRRFPTGWDLNGFSSDRGSAVFSDGQGGQVRVNLKTGEQSHGPQNGPQPVPFDWTNLDFEKPIIDRDHRMVGITAHDVAIPLNFSAAHMYVPSVRVRDGRAAIHLRGHGEPRRDTHDLWTCRAAAGATPNHIAKDVAQFALLNDKALVFTQSIHPSELWREQEKVEETFVYQTQSKTMWNVLDGVPELAHSPSQTELILGASSKSNEQACVLVDMRWFNPAAFRDAWHRLVLVRSNHGRLLVEEVPPEFAQRDHEKTWVDEQGHLFFATTEWVDTGDLQRKKQYRVFFIDLTD